MESSSVITTVCLRGGLFASFVYARLRGWSFDNLYDSALLAPLPRDSARLAPPPLHSALLAPLPCDYAPWYKAFIPLFQRFGYFRGVAPTFETVSCAKRAPNLRQTCARKYVIRRLIFPRPPAL